MAREFKIQCEGELVTTPEEYWDAITTGAGGWLWPMEFEPRQGGAAPFGGSVTVWDQPHHLVSRVEGEGGWFNQVEHEIKSTDSGAVRFRYVHSGILVDDWDNQYDGARQHTEFYLHTLGEYLRYFSRRPVSYFATDAPDASKTAGALDTVRRALGVTDDVNEGDNLTLDLPGVGTTEVVVDYLQPNFLGVRSGAAMYRFFGRNAFGAPVGIAVHDFAPSADAVKSETVWRDWFGGVFA